MRKLPLLLSALGWLVACSGNEPSVSHVHSIASNLSDKDGKLARTFLYLIDGDNVRQRECQVAAPQSVQDCNVLRSTKKLSDFRTALDADIKLSRDRVNQALSSLQTDRNSLNQRKSDLTLRIQQLQDQINQASTPSGEDVGQLKAALDFAESQRMQIAAQLAQTTDPQKKAELQQTLKAFDRQIAELKSRIALAQGGDTAELKRQLAEAQANLNQVNADLNGLNAKIQQAEAQRTVIEEEIRIETATLEKLKQAVVFDARDASFNASEAEKQLSSRFHKLFQVSGPDCTPPVVNALKELSSGDAFVFGSKEAQVGGSWHIGEIVKQLLGGNPSTSQVEAFFRTWVQNWSQDTRVGTDVASARPDFMKVIDDWKNASVARGINGLDLRIAPFRLIGIANRLDVRNPLLAGDAGEARIAYALLDKTSDRPQDDDQTTRRFTLIFEYRVSVGSDSEIGRWAALWHELGSLSGDAYVSRLAQITRLYTHRNQGSFVQSRLSQVRTNEIAFGSPWEQREFNLQAGSGDANARLVPVDVKKTPRQSANNTAALNQFVSSLSLDNIIRNNYDIPVNLRGAKAQVLGGAPEWTVNVDAARASAFNLNTCNGCHSSDQKVIDGFYHISPAQPLGQAAMSPFLKNEELPHRATNLASFLVDPSCQAGTPFDARLALDAPLALSRPVH